MLTETVQELQDILLRLQELERIEADRLTVPPQQATFADVDAAVGGETCCLTMELWRYDKSNRRTIEFKIWDGQNHYAGATLEEAYRKFLAVKESPPPGEPLTEAANTLEEAVQGHVGLPF